MVNILYIRKMKEATGITTLLGAMFLNIFELIGGVPLNGWFVIATSIGGLIYLYWKIVTQRKESKKLDLEIGRERLAFDKEKLEIERLRNEVKS